jgi:hypothetical protein
MSTEIPNPELLPHAAAISEKVEPTEFGALTSRVQALMDKCEDSSLAKSLRKTLGDIPADRWNEAIEDLEDFFAEVRPSEQSEDKITGEIFWRGQVRSRLSRIGHEMMPVVEPLTDAETAALEKERGDDSESITAEIV